MAEFIEFLSPKALEDMQKANSELVEMVANVDKVGQKMKNISTPSGSDNALKSLTLEYQKQEKAIQSLQKKIETLTAKKSEENNAIAKTMRALEKETKARQDLDKQRQRALSLLEKEQQKLSAAESLYNKVDTRLKLLSVSYRDLAIKKELGFTLTAKEERQYASLQSRIQKYDIALKAVDITMGKHGRKVGDYASAFNPLSNSFNQLTREAPAFANSIQTGFMAISNNLPIFFDAIQQVILQNKELQAQGKPTQSVLSAISSSLFSFQTLLSVGVTLLTIYGKEIVNWVSSLWGASEALDELNKNQKEFNKSRIEGKKNSQEDILNLRKYLAVAKDTTANEDFRREAVKKLREQYYYYFKNLTDAQIMTGKYGSSVNELTKALERKGQIELATSLNVSNKQRLIDLEEERKKLLQLEKITNDRLKSALKNNVAGQALGAISDELSRVQRKRLEIDRDIVKFQSAIIQNDGIIFDLKKKTIALEIQEEKTREKILKIKREELKVLSDGIKEQEANSLLATLENQKKQLEEFQRTVAKTNEEWRLYQKTIDLVKKAIDELTNTNDYLAESAKNADEQFKKQIKREEEAVKALRKLQDATDEYLKSFASDFFSDAGLGSLNFFTRIQSNGLTMFQELMAGATSTQEKFAIAFNGIADIAQEAFALINQSSDAYFNRQFELLSKQKEISLKYAGDSATAREEIEKQYEERRKQIERKKAEEQKKTAMFNIIVDTAQAVISTLAQTPPPAGIPLALLVGAIGAAQLAVVASQQVPAYAEGTENHTGGPMLINDAKGSNYVETVQTPDGKLKQYKGRNVLVNAPKGTKVFTPEQFNNQLNTILMDNEIAKQNINIEAGISPAEMDGIMSKYFSKIQVNQMVFDKNGFNNFTVKAHQKTQELKNIASFKGFSV